MATIAELQINVDSTPTERATKALTDFAAAADKAATAGRSKVQADNNSSTSSEKVATSEKKLADLIDYQSRKLTKLAEQRELVSKSGLQDKSVAEYTRLNSIIDANIALVQRQGNAQDALAAKQDRDLAKLQNIATAYDPVQRAILTYERSLKALDEGYASGKLSVDEYNKALAAQQAQLEKVRAAQPGSSSNEARQYQEALDKLVPYRTELRNLAEQQAILDQRRSKGGLSATEAKDLDVATEAIKRQTTEINKRISAGNNFGNTLKQDQQALRGLPAQFTDIVVSLQGGQAPLTVLLQQGGQIKDTFGGVVPALKGVATGLAAIVTPATVAGAAIALVAYQAYQGSQELNEFNKAVVQSGGFSGTSTSQFTQYRDQIASVTGNASQAADALVALERSGKIAGDAFVQIGIAAINMQKATGQAIQQTVDDFASLAKDPVNAVVALDDKYKFLTASVLSQIDALQRNGDTAAALTVAQNALAVATDEAANRIIDRLGFVERAWNAVKGAIGSTGSALANIGRDQSAADELAETIERIARAERDYRGGGAGDKYSEKNIQNDPIIQRDKERVKQLQTYLAYEKFGAEQTAQTERQRAAAVAATVRINAGATAAASPVERIRADIDKAQRDQATIAKEAAEKGQQLTQDQLNNYARYKADLDKKLQDAIEAEQKKARGPSAPADTGQVQEVRSNLELINKEYESAYKKVTALGEANVVSAAATFASQKAILEAQKNAVVDSYDAQISAIQALQNNKKNSAATNISLDNQLTKAEADRLKSLEDIDTKLEVLQTKEKGRLAQREANIEAYNESLRQQIENVSTAGQRAVNAVGQGDRQGQLNEDLAQADRQFAKEQLSLSKQLSKGLDPEEYARKLADLKAAHTDMTQTILANDRDIQAANADWTNGFTRAVQNAQDDGANFAAATNAAVSGAFNSMGAALGEFVVTGKISFRDLATSIISDMARIAAQQAASAALGQLFGLFIAGAGAAATPASTTTSVGGNTNTFNPQLNTGGITYKAKGGAYDGGTEFFARGGAFTNSIVSSPTAFGIAGGRTGIMGEAGPEAIVPLARTSDGSLGVRLAGGGSQEQSFGGVSVHVNISGDGNVNADGQTPDLATFGRDIGTFVDARYRQLLKRSLSDGGEIKNAISGR